MWSSASLNSAINGSSIGARNRPTLSWARCHCTRTDAVTGETDQPPRYRACDDAVMDGIDIRDHDGRRVPARRGNDRHSTDACADERRGLGQARPPRIVGGLRRALGVGWRAVRGQRWGVSVRHARSRRCLVTDERRHTCRRAQHPPPPRPAAGIADPPAHRGSRAGSGAGEPAGQRDAHLPTLRFRTRWAQHRGDIDIP